MHRWNDFDRLILSIGHDFCGNTSGDPKNLLIIGEEGKNANAMGVIRNGIIGHWLEAALEFLERLIWNEGADDDPLYDMHVKNAENFLQKR